MEKIFKIVYRHPALSGMDFERISECHNYIKFKKGEILHREGKVSDEYYLLESGVVRAFVHDYNLNEITTEFFIPNDIVIIPSSLFQKIPSKENLQTVTDCKLLKIHYEDFQKLFHEIEGFREWGRMWFSEQVFTMKQRSLDMITETATNRYLKLMKEKPDIIKYAQLKQIASYLGITDSSLSRIRKEILK